MWYSTIASVALCLVFTEAATPYKPVKRTADVQLYAYGTNIPGLAVYTDDDDLAYIADPSANLTALTWTIDTSGTLPWNVTTGAVTNSTVSSAAFYIVTDDDAYEQAGFRSSNGSVPTGATTTGLLTYGPYVMYLSSDGTYLSEFWATSTNTSGVWALMWNAAGASKTNSVPISLKTTAPISS